jgi:phosphoglucomutase
MYGFYKESLLSITRKGKRGESAIKKMMTAFRLLPPRRIAGSRVETTHDFLSQRTIYNIQRKGEMITLPKSNVLQFITEDESKITIRPSGTEPKIKIYISVKAPMKSVEKYAKVNLMLDEKINNILRSLKLDKFTS